MLITNSRGPSSHRAGNDLSGSDAIESDFSIRFTYTRVVVDQDLRLPGALAKARIPYYQNIL